MVEGGHELMMRGVVVVVKLPPSALAQRCKCVAFKHKTVQFVIFLQNSTKLSQCFQCFLKIVQGRVRNIHSCLPLILNGFLFKAQKRIFFT
jgi:hypothetical protein